MRYINLTPDTVTVCRDGAPAVRYPPSGTVARVEETLVTDAAAPWVSYGRVIDIPPATPDTCCIVPLLPALLLSDTGRWLDILVPRGVVRDEDGIVIGCEGLAHVGLASPEPLHPDLVEGSLGLDLLRRVFDPTRSGPVVVDYTSKARSMPFSFTDVREVPDFSISGDPAENDEGGLVEDYRARYTVVLYDGRVASIEWMGSWTDVQFG